MSYSIPTKTKSIIHNIAFNFYGNRFATCSNDHEINIFELSSSNEWYNISQWRAHNGPITRIIWAHPEFGSLIASCSYDRTIIVWEESANFQDHFPKKKINWMKTSCILDSKSCVTCIEFMPYTGYSIKPLYNGGSQPFLEVEAFDQPSLIIASTSASGLLRFYQAGVETENSHWSLLHEINVLEHHNSTTTAAKPAITSTNESLSLPNNNVNADLCLSWSHCKIFPTLVAVGVRYNTDLQSPSTLQIPSGFVSIYHINLDKRKCVLKEKNVNENFIKNGISDVKFCPDTGKPFHLLALATYEEITLLAITHTNYCEPSNKKYLSKHYKLVPGVTSSDLEIYEVAQLRSPHKIWRLTWNLFGTTIACNTEEGFIIVWKKNLERWELVSQMKNDLLYIKGQDVNKSQILKNFAELTASKKSKNPLEVVWH